MKLAIGRLMGNGLLSSLVVEYLPVQASTHHSHPSFFSRLRAWLRGLVRFQREDCQVHIRLEQQSLPYVFMLALVWYVISPNTVSSCAAVALGGLLLAAYLWARGMALRVTALRTLRYSAFQVGDELEEIITVTNDSWLPILWAQFSDHSDLPGYSISGVRGANPHSTVHWRFHTTCTQRGVFTLGPWELRLGDPFGIFCVAQRYTQSKEILIYPPLAHIPRHLLPHTSAFGDQRTSPNPLQAETILAYSTRAYQPGDPLHRIHWPTSAHRNQIYVRQFDPMATSAAWLVADFDASPHLVKGDDSSLETMIILLATLADWLLHEQFAVGMYANVNSALVLPPQRGQPAFWRLLRAIAPLYATSSQPFSQTLRAVQPLLGERDMLLAVTPSLDPAWASQLRQVHNHRRVHALLLDPHSFGGQSARPYGQLLASLDISSSLIRREDVQPIPASYGVLRRWEFKTLSTGRVILMQTPRQAGSTSTQPGHEHG